MATVVTPQRESERRRLGLNEVRRSGHCTAIRTGRWKAPVAGIQLVTPQGMLDLTKFFVKLQTEREVYPTLQSVSASGYLKHCRPVAAAPGTMTRKVPRIAPGLFKQRCSKVNHKLVAIPLASRLTS